MGEKMCRVSIIVPVYYGKKYITSIISQAEACQKQAGNQAEIELVLVNDAPEDVLEEHVSSEVFRVVVLNTDVNRGIHGARVWGLQNCTGKYVLFLDQDDRIEPHYIQSQLKNIRDSDAVVCRCIHENKPYYNADYPFEKMMCGEYMLEEGCPIISPGQVLIRRASIPSVWTENIMRHNCADDFLLWLCMAGYGKSFALNQEILFEHVVRYNNTSWNSLQMMDSEAEMVQILKANQVFSGEALDRMLYKIKKKHLSNLDKFRKMFYILNDWTTLRQTGNGIAEYLKREGYHNVAIYGMGYLGKQLLLEIETSAIVKIRYLIDRNAEWIQENYPVCTLEDELEAVDIIIVTLAQSEKAVVNELKQKTKAVVCTIRELVNRIGEEKGYDKGICNHSGL